MKRKSLAIDLKVKALTSAGQSLVLAAALSGPFSAVLPLKQAHASAELDRAYSLQTIAALRTYDNVDGIFSESFASAYRDYFVKQPRFTYIELGKADALFADSKLPYLKVIEDREILGQLSRVLRVESLLRTKILKEGPRYRVSVQWLHSPHMVVMASEEFFLLEPDSGEPLGPAEIRVGLFSALDRLIGQVPFLGNVSGRDGSVVTVNLGASSGVRKGDELRVATLDEVKKHPLLNQVMDWRFSPTGRLIVEQIEDGIAFCRVEEVEKGRQISRGQKIVQWIAAPPERAEKKPTGEAWEQDEDSVQPRLGWASLGLDLGSLSRSYSQVTGGTGFDGSGLLFGTRFETQIWLDRKWFGEAHLGAGTASLGLTDTLTGAPVATTSVSTSVTSFRISAGRMFLASHDFYGPRGWIKLGYQKFSFRQPIDVTHGVSPTSFSGLSVGVGGDLPIRNGFGAQVGLDFGLFPTGEESGLSLENPSSASVVSFFVGGYYQLSPRFRLKAGLDALLTGVDFTSNEGTTVSQRAISFVPSLVYFF